MHKKKDYEEYIELEDILEQLKMCKIPALTLDIRWQSIFNTEDKSSKIAKLEKKVNEALKSRGRITTDRKDLIKLKKQLMNEIVRNMNSPENSRADKKIRKSKELIEEINNKLILLEDEELDLPGKFEEANAELSLESMKEIFDKYEENQEDIETLEEWIEETREELKKRVALLHQKKEDNERMDKYLSHLIDSDIIRQYKKYRDLDD